MIKSHDSSIMGRKGLIVSCLQANAMNRYNQGHRVNMQAWTMMCAVLENWLMKAYRIITALKIIIILYIFLQKMRWNLLYCSV